MHYNSSNASALNFLLQFADNRASKPHDRTVLPIPSLVLNHSADSINLPTSSTNRLTPAMVTVKYQRESTSDD